MEVRGRGASHGGGCIDCVRLVRREKARRDRDKTIEERDVDEEQKRKGEQEI